MKQSLKSQQFKLPLIEQRDHSSNRPSKSTTKRSQFSNNASQINLYQKQKNFNKLSKFHLPPDKKLRQENRSAQHKAANQIRLHTPSDNQSDFEQKIKQNKILLKKHKLKKELEKRTRSISKKMNKENLPEFDKLPQIKSKKVLQPKRSNKKLISYLVNTDSKDWVGTIMKGPNLKRSKSNGNLPKINLKSKLQGSDVFQNIHLFLKALQSDVPMDDDNTVPKQKIYSKLLKYKEKLNKMQPNSQFVKSLDQTIQRKRSMPKKNNQKSPQSTTQNHLRYMTSSQWAKVSMSREDFKFVASNFDDQVDKINTYLNKTSLSLEELLKHRLSIIDLLVLKKLKEKKSVDERLNLSMG